MIAAGKSSHPTPGRLVRKLANEGHSAKALDAFCVFVGCSFVCSPGAGSGEVCCGSADRQPFWPLLMPAATSTCTVSTHGKGTYEITEQVANFVVRSGVRNGNVTVFVRHTSCSLIIMENADPTARRDLEEFFERLVPEDTPYFEHTAEGGDDSTSHIRSVLTRSSEVIPIAEGRMQLGTWQGIFLFEHRRAPHQREIALSIIGS